MDSAQHVIPSSGAEEMVRVSRLAASVLAAAFVLAATTAAAPSAARADEIPLASWENEDAREDILEFVRGVAKPGPGFVPVEERVAVFDNDGTLWAEQPVYFQVLFALDRIRELAPQHPEWKTTEPFASILRGDEEKALSSGYHAVTEIITATHDNVPTDEYVRTVEHWIATAR